MASKAASSALPNVASASRSSANVGTKASKNEKTVTEKKESNVSSQSKTSAPPIQINAPASKTSPSKVEKLPSIATANKGNNSKQSVNNAKSKALTELPASPILEAQTAVNSDQQISSTDLSPTQETAIVEAVVTTAQKQPEPIVAAPPILVKEEPPIPLVNNNNGKVKLIYEQYDEEFPILAGSTTQENIDEVYCLSFVMPNCKIHLSVHPPPVKRKIESDAIDASKRGDEKSLGEAYALYKSLYLEEDPAGTYRGLENDKTYYVYVEQEAEQLARDQEETRLRLQVEKSQPKLPKDDGRAMESCSCIYGNPCVDEYGCKDWDNRYAVAMKNGWKGF